MFHKALGAPGVTSGLRVAASQAGREDAVAAELCRVLGPGPFAQIVVFFSPDTDAGALARALAAAFGDTPVCGCSSAGEIAPAGYIESGVLAVGFEAAHFTVSSDLVEDLGRADVEATFQVSLELRARLLAATGPAPGSERFCMILVDGVSKAEERFLAAVRSAIHDCPIIGGTAGDNLAFDQTTIIFRGRAYSDAGILLMLHTRLPFRTFRTQNFELTATKLVVTAADVENRIVHEFNAEPAAVEYATSIGSGLDDLNPMRFAQYPVAVQVGRDYYCRSIRNVNPDGSLTFYCAIDEGLVLTVARPKDLVDTTREALETLRDDLGGIGVVLGFECILRRLDAESRQAKRQLEQLYRDFNVIGFHTYGEQFNALHLNQTLTGIAIGTLRTRDDRG